MVVTLARPHVLKYVGDEQEILNLTHFKTFKQLSLER